MDDTSMERRRIVSISEETLEEIAERAAEKAIIKMEQRLYVEIGRTFIYKVSKIIGIALIALLIFLNKDLKGIL